MGIVRSADGGVIGYDSVGRGPGLLLLHGAMEVAASHRELAEALADRWTVHLPDRRDRRGSAAATPGRDREQSVDDVRGLLDATDARTLVGVSSGAVIALDAALAVPDAIDAVVAFEPPLFADPRVPQRFAARIERELAEGRLPAALVTGWLAIQLGPSWVRRLPRPLLERMVAAGAWREQRTAADPAATMLALARSLPHDFRLVAASSGPSQRFAGLAAPVLLLGGDRSPAYLREALDTLQQVLPHAHRETLRGMGHEALGNAAQRGRPADAAAVIQAFLESAQV